MPGMELVVCLLAGAALASGSLARPLEVSAMTFNIRFGTAQDGPNAWQHRREAVFEVVRTSGCDVIGLQEALRFQIEEIAEEVPEYAWIGVGRDDGVAAGEHSAILYRKDRLRVVEQGTFWFSDTPDLIASATWGNRITRICTWARFETRNGRQFWHYNLHLDHESQASREKSTALLAQRIRQDAGDLPVLVTGDFNAGEGNPAVLSLLESAGLQNAFRALYPMAKPVGTFTAFDPLAIEGEMIDYVLADSRAKVLEATIWRDTPGGVLPSDHFPVTARLRWP